MRLSKKSKILLGAIGTISIGGVLFLILKNKFGNTPVELWRRGNNTAQISDTRASIHQLQNLQKSRERQAEAEARRKAVAERAAEQREWNRREAIWEENVKAINQAQP